MIPNHWVTALRAAKELNLSVYQLYKLIDSGALPAYRVGRVYRIRRQDLDDYQAAQQ